MIVDQRVYQILKPSICQALRPNLGNLLLIVTGLLRDGVKGGGEEGRLVLVEGGVGGVLLGGEGGLEHGEGVSEGDAGSLSKHCHLASSLTRSVLRAERG